MGRYSTPAARPRPLPHSFGAWLDLSRDDEVLALLDLVRAALERRGFVPPVEYVKPKAAA